MPDAAPEIIEFETPRLRLRRWRDADRAPFAALNADPVVMEYFPRCSIAPRASAMIDRFEAAFEGVGGATGRRRSSRPASSLGSSGSRSRGSPSASRRASRSAGVSHARTGAKGYATEGASGALRAGFERVGLDEILSWTSVVNRRSRAVMERIGMHDTHEDFEHPGDRGGASAAPACSVSRSPRGVADGERLADYRHSHIASAYATVASVSH